MARQHGKNGRVYFDVVGGGSAAPLPFVAKWTADFAVDFVEVTALGDTNKVRVAGLPDSKFTASGFYDDSTKQTYTAASDGLARNFYLYPSILNVGTYWFGQVFADFSTTGGVGEAIAMSFNAVAATAISRVG
jgi:hypothetical protein